MMSISVVVVAYNSADWLSACLQSLLDSASLELNIRVVDNSSADGTAELVESRFPSVEVLRSSTNLGFGGGANLGLKTCGTDIIVVVNPDVVIRHDALAALANIIQQKPDVAVAGCKLLYPGGKTIQHAGGTLSYPLALADHYGYGEEDEGQYDQMREVEYVTGAVVAIRRSLLDEIGHFDEGFYPGYFEEADLCFRARKAGYKVLYVPQAVAIHHEATTLGKHTLKQYHFYHRNRLRFVLKHYSEEQLWQDFFPAELQRLRQMELDLELAALQKAYGDNLAVLADQADFIVNPAAAHHLPVSQKRLEMLRVLEGRAEGLVFSRKASAGMSEDLLAILHSKRQIAEQPFNSGWPVAGPLIIGIRRLWNWMSTKWYVRPLIEQQNDFNAYVVESLRLTNLSIQAIEASIVERARNSALQKTELAQLETEFKRIQEQMYDIRGQLADLKDPELPRS